MAAQKPKPTSFNLLPKIINGGVAGIVGVTIIFPIDVVKTRLQNQPIGPNGEKMYSSIIDCFRQSIKREGYFGMYKGASVNIILVTPEKAVKLAANDFFRYHFMSSDGSLPLYRQGAAGALAGCFQILITTPMELLKLNMQDQGREAAQAEKEGRKFKRKSTFVLTRDMLREKGFFGLYKGFGACACRDIVWSAVYFPMFAAINDRGPRKYEGSEEAVFYWSFLGGLISSGIMSWAVTPFDVIKTRLQAVTTTGNKYNGFLDCAAKTYQHEGVTAFFKGALCRIMVLCPLYGIVQMVYYIGVGEYLLGIKKP